MKVGSVEFFKAMIKISLLVVLPLCLVLLITVSVWFSIYHKNTSEQIRDLEARIEQLESVDGVANVSSGHSENQMNNSHKDYVNIELSGRPQSNRPASPEHNEEVIIDNAYAEPEFDYLPDFWQPAAEFDEPPLQKTAYLTFDDGPSPVTLDILDTLDLYDIKATFFVISRRHDYEIDILKEVVARGHTIGMHSDSHDPQKMYQSVEAYLADLYANYLYIHEITGSYPRIYRFVGGSNSKYNSVAAAEIVTAMTQRGFSYFDWNSSAEDAVEPHPDAKRIASNVLSTADSHQLVVLSHDSGARTLTAQALPEIIEELQDRGYTFDVLDISTKPVRFPVRS